MSQQYLSTLGATHSLLQQTQEIKVKACAGKEVRKKDAEMPKTGLTTQEITYVHVFIHTDIC